MANKTIIMRAFNQHFKDFADDIQQLFPDNLKIRTYKNSLYTFIKMNPKKVIELWYTNLTIKYNNQILNEDIDFFLNKEDYADDIKNIKDDVIKGIGLDVDNNLIEQLKEPISNMDEVNKKKAIKYVKEMTQLSSLYFS
jgi:hypothetical protein